MKITPEILKMLNDAAYRLKARGDYEGFECYRRHYLAAQAIYWQRTHPKRVRR